MMLVKFATGLGVILLLVCSHSNSKNKLGAEKNINIDFSLYNSLGQELRLKTVGNDILLKEDMQNQISFYWCNWKSVDGKITLYPKESISFGVERKIPLESKDSLYISSSIRKMPTGFSCFLEGNEFKKFDSVVYFENPAKEWIIKNQFFGEIVYDSIALDSRLSSCIITARDIDSIEFLSTYDIYKVKYFSKAREIDYREWTKK